MYKDSKIWMAQSGEKSLYLLPNMANRHGLIAGATGTGKTITMKVMAESFSDMGVPVFFSDVKGDLSGMCKPGEDSDSMRKRIASFGIDDFNYHAYPTRFWDIFGEEGHPVRVTISDMGPLLLSRLLGLSDVQQGVLNIAFRAADDNGLLLLDLKDLRAMLRFISDNAAEYTSIYGNVSSASVGAIQRALLAFEEEGGEGLFSEPALDIRDWMRTDVSGRGYINILSSRRLIQSPTVYSTFTLWMLSDLFEKLPEVGDLEKPRMVFFFDEAHLLFEDAPKALVQKVVQVIKLIRSKGVGIYFVTQSPSDIPDEVLAQLSNRVQHALRAYTPAEMKSIKATADAFRTNSAFDTQSRLMELGVGEALVSFLDEKGIPCVVEDAKILPPQSLMGAADESLVRQIITADEFELKYRQVIDRESAYEILQKAALIAEEQRQAEAEAAAAAKEEEKAAKAAEKEAAAAAKQQAKVAKQTSKTGSKKTAAEKAATRAATTVATSLSRNLLNTVLGGSTSDAKTIAKRAATNALSSVMRSASTDIVRGLFGNRK